MIKLEPLHNTKKVVRSVLQMRDDTRVASLSIPHADATGGRSLRTRSHQPVRLSMAHAAPVVGVVLPMLDFHVVSVDVPVEIIVLIDIDINFAGPPITTIPDGIADGEGAQAMPVAMAPPRT